MIDKDSALINERYRKGFEDFVIPDIDTLTWIIAKIVRKQPKKTSNSIRKKYRALKTGKMEEIALERNFKLLSTR